LARDVSKVNTALHIRVAVVADAGRVRICGVPCGKDEPVPSTASANEA
jgi:hypothetical protein